MGLIATFLSGPIKPSWLTNGWVPLNSGVLLWPNGQWPERWDLPGLPENLRFPEKVRAWQAKLPLLIQISGCISSYRVSS